MKNLFGVLQVFGFVLAFTGLGWAVGAIIGASKGELLMLWEVVLPAVLAAILMLLGYGLEWIYDKGVDSTSKEEDE